MIIGEIEPSGMDRGEPLNDKEFIEDLVTRLLTKVKDLEGTPKLISNIVVNTSKHNDTDVLQFIGGDTDRQKSSGLMGIEKLKARLVLINDSTIDLQKDEYIYLGHVLKSLDNHEPDKNWGKDLIRLQNMEIERDQSSRSKAA